MSNLIVREFNGKKIRHRADGFMSLTDMCQANGKILGNWTRLDATKEYLKALQSKCGSVPIEINEGGNHASGLTGTWGDRRVAIRLAQWLSPEFAIQVDEWVVELLKAKIDQETLEKSFLLSLYEVHNRKQSAYVYALHDQANGRVKIGFTQNPLQRLKQLQMGDSTTLPEFYGVKRLNTKGEAQMHEKYLHELFQADRISGEWFNDDLMIDARFEDYFFPGGSEEFIRYESMTPETSKMEAL